MDQLTKLAIETLQDQTNLIKKQLEVKDVQLKEKDAQIREKDNQLYEAKEQLKEMVKLAQSQQMTIQTEQKLRFPESWNLIDNEYNEVEQDEDSTTLQNIKTPDKTVEVKKNKIFEWFKNLGKIKES